jgi:arsenate reductase-like glutaredoxin family protein
LWGEIVDAMVKNPDLIQRPIVEKGARGRHASRNSSIGVEAAL